MHFYFRELSNLQSKIQKHAAFESELAANKGRIDDVANHGEGLIGETILLYFLMLK